MQIGFYLKLSIMIGCLLALTGGPVFAFVTPEHYEKLKQEARIKEKNESKPLQEVPGKIQVHPPAASQGSSSGSTKK